MPCISKKIMWTRDNELCIVNFEFHISSFWILEALRLVIPVSPAWWLFLQTGAGISGPSTPPPCSRPQPGRGATSRPHADTRPAGSATGTPCNSAGRETRIRCSLTLQSKGIFWTRDTFPYTVEPPNKGHLGISHFVLCWEVVLVLEVPYCLGSSYRGCAGSFNGDLPYYR